MDGDAGESGEEEYQKGRSGVQKDGQVSQALTVWRPLQQPTQKGVCPCPTIFLTRQYTTIPIAMASEHRNISMATLQGQCKRREEMDLVVLEYQLQ